MSQRSQSEKQNTLADRLWEQVFMAWPQSEDDFLSLKAIKQSTKSYRQQSGLSL